MKKQIIALNIAIVLVLSISLYGCSNSNVAEKNEEVSSDVKGTTVKNNNQSNKDSSFTVATKKTEAENGDISVDDIGIISSRIFEKYDTSHCILVVKNNGAADANITIKSIAYDANNSVIGVGSETIRSLGANCTTAVEIYFNDTINIEKCENEIEVKVDKKKRSILQDLQLKTDVLDNKVIITCTNNGDKIGDFIKAIVIYLDNNGNIVGTEDVYLHDSDDEIKPDDTIVEQTAFSSLYEYSSVEVYLQGRAK